MTFLAKPVSYTREMLQNFVNSTQMNKSWLPKFPTLHNAGVPSLATYESFTPAEKAAWPHNLNEYYKRLGWHSGPHFMVCPEYVWNLCDLAEDGISVSCWNKDTIGIEMSANFEPGGDDPETGLGLQVIENAAYLIALLCVKFDWDPAHYKVGVAGLHFHRECLRDNHACPGSLVDKTKFLQRVVDEIAKLKGTPDVKVETQPTVPTVDPHQVMSQWPPAGDPFYDRAKLVYSTWRGFGVSHFFAIGMLVQAEAESTITNKVVGDHNTAFGMYQWHPARVEAIKAGCGIDIMTFPSLEDQCKAAWWELQHSEHTALKMLTEAKTVNEAGAAGAKYYERPRADETVKRGAMADRWEKWFTDNHIAN